VALLPTGCISFHVVSCTQDFAFRVYPMQTYGDEPCRLRCGDPCAVVAQVGGEDDGHSPVFYISERRAAVVSIYIDLLEGAAAVTGVDPVDKGDGKGAAGTSRGVAVWYVFETDPARWRTAVPLDDRGTARSPTLGHGNPAGLPPVEVIPNVEELDPAVSADILEQAARLMDTAKEELKYIPRPTWEASDMWIKRYHEIWACDYYEHYHTGELRWTHPDEDAEAKGVRRVAVLLDTMQKAAVGFCKYSLLPRSCFVIEEFAIAEPLRGKRLGTVLILQMLELAKMMGYATVELWSLVTACRFYQRVGFRFDDDQVLLPQDSWGPVVRMVNGFEGSAVCASP